MSRPAGARSADDTDAAALQLVGEGQRRAADDRGSAVRPHHQETELARLLLQRTLVLDRDIVAEHHDMQPAAQRLAGFRGGEIAGHGNQREIDAFAPFHRRRNAAGAPGFAAFGLGFGFVELRFCLGERRAGRNG